MSRVRRIIMSIDTSFPITSCATQLSSELRIMSLPSKGHRTPRPKIAMGMPMRVPEDDPVAYREQSFALGEKIDFARDSVCTVSAINDENNNSQLLNTSVRRDTMEGRYSITTQGPRFSDVDLSPKERLGGMGGLSTIEEGQEDSRGSYEVTEGQPRGPVEPWRSSIAESEDLAGEVDGMSIGSRCSIMSLGQLPPARRTMTSIAPPGGALGNRIDRLSLASILSNHPGRSTLVEEESEAKRRKMSQLSTCCIDEDDEDYRPSLTLARARAVVRSVSQRHLIGSELPVMPVTEERSEEPVETDEANESEEGGAEVDKEEISGPACEPVAPPAVPKHSPSPPPPPPPISSAKGSPPAGLPLIGAKGKAPLPPFLNASAKGKAPLPSLPGLKNGKAPPPTPLKAAIKMGPPVAPLRPLFWTSVPMGPRDRLQNNFWKSVKQGSKLIDEDTIPWCADYVDENELQAIFGQNATKTSSSKSASGRPGSAPALQRRKVMKLLDDKRSYILAIAFRPLPGPDELLHIIASGNVSALTGAQLSMLADEVPTPDVVEELYAMESRAEQEGKRAQWDTPEQYLVALSTVKDAKSVLKAWAFGANVRDGLLGDARDQLEALNAACQAMKESKELVDLVRVMLSIGNRVNANTARGGAEILSMDSLLRFDNVRSPCDTSMTLLKYCVQTWKKKNGRSPSMISMFTKMLRPVTHPKTKIPDIKEIDKDVKRIAGLSREAKTLLGCLRQQPNYDTEVIPLVEEGMKKTDELQDYLKKTMVSWKSTLEYFCVKNESPLADKSDEFFDTMKNFIQLVGNYATTD